MPTLYAGVNLVLCDLLAEVQAILGAHFAGMYLSGSLALGDFDPASSDIDIVVVTNDALSDDTFVALQEMHTHLAAGGSPWAAKLEAVYIPRAVLRRGPLPGTRYPQLERGRALAIEPLESAWVVQGYTLREHGVAVAGPAAHTLIDPPDPDDLRRASAAVAELWLEQGRRDPAWLAWLRRRSDQAFVVLTLCRLLYTLDSGAVASKPGAARWAQPRLGPGWAGLIERSLAGRQDSAATPQSDVDETVAMIRYTVDQFQMRS